MIDKQAEKKIRRFSNYLSRASNYCNTHESNNHSLFSRLLFHHEHRSTSFSL